MRILGFKTLRLSDNSVRSIARPGTWTGGRLRASCLDIRYDERNLLRSQCDWNHVPGLSCNCGIWAVSPYPDLAHTYLSASNRFLCVVQGIGKTIRTVNKDNFRHKGFRTKEAKILALVELDPEVYRSNLNAYYVLPLKEIEEVIGKVQTILDVPVVPMEVASAMVETNYEEWENSDGRNW